MFKSEIFHLCRRNLWGQPVYSVVKLGPDHGPSFLATVTINGSSFHAPEHSRSTKEAQNKAAKVAFDHLSTSSTNKQIMNPNPNINPPSPPPQQQVSEEVVPTVPRLSPDGKHVHKNLLREYAQKNRIPYPKYSSDFIISSSQGKRFRSKVSVGGEIYESPNYYFTEKEAENAAATVACEKLMQDNDILKAENSMYKSLLFELATKRRLVLNFDTKLHMNLFTSSVKIVDKTFVGQPTGTKKWAENSAAKVAYTAIKEGDTANQNTTGSNLSPILNNQQLTKTIPSSNSGNLPDEETELVQRPQLKATIKTYCDQSWASLLELPEYSIKDALDNSLSVLIAAFSGEFDMNNKSAVAEGKDVAMDVDGSKDKETAMECEVNLNGGDLPQVRKLSMEATGCTMKCDLLETRDYDVQVKRAKLSHPDAGKSNSSISFMALNQPSVEPFLELMLQEGGTVTLSCDKIAIYPRVPNLAFPDDGSITVLPFQNDKWVAVGVMEKK